MLLNQLSLFAGSFGYWCSMREADEECSDAMAIVCCLWEVYGDSERWQLGRKWVVKPAVVQLMAVSKHGGR